LEARRAAELRFGGASPWRDSKLIQGLGERTDMDQKEQWNARYAGEGFLFGEEPNAFLKSHEALLRPGMKALAIADGEGRNGVWLAQQGLEVLSTDVSEIAQSKAAQLAQSRGVSLDLQLVDVGEWEWPLETFDLVAAIFIQFAGPAERERIFAGIRRTLKPGGLLLLEGYRPEQLGYGTGGPPNVENLYTASMLRDAFAGFEILDLSEYDAEVQEGSAHSGMSALIDLVARKRLSGRS
jgi:cyclopropane fatty-acyl-phospholipid synthase-like methyltransferase